MFFPPLLRNKGTTRTGSTPTTRKVPQNLSVVYLKKHKAARRHYDSYYVRGFGGSFPQYTLKKNDKKGRYSQDNCYGSAEGCNTTLTAIKRKNLKKEKERGPNEGGQNKGK